MYMCGVTYFFLHLNLLGSLGQSFCPLVKLVKTFDKYRSEPHQHTKRIPLSKNFSIYLSGSGFCLFAWSHRCWLTSGGFIYCFVLKFCAGLLYNMASKKLRIMRINKRKAYVELEVLVFGVVCIVELLQFRDGVCRYRSRI